jgi:hypothetical protein
MRHASLSGIGELSTDGPKPFDKFTSALSFDNDLGPRQTQPHTFCGLSLPNPLRSCYWP